MRQLCKGNVAVVKGAILAGCRAYYGYPITPASEIAEAAALYDIEAGQSPDDPLVFFNRGISLSRLGRLEDALVLCSEVWRQGLPLCSISWFDEKTAHLAGVRIGSTARCGFGDGEVQVGVARVLELTEKGYALVRP